MTVTDLRDPIVLDQGIVLRPFTAADAPAMHTLIATNQDHLDEWLRWSSAIRSRRDAEDLIAWFEDKLRAGDGFHLGIWVDDHLAGGCACWYIHRQNRNAEVGYWLGKAYVGRGLATRSARAVVGYLFAHENLHRIEMQCAVDNHASRAIPERLGFRMEGVRRESHWITTRFRDHAVYGLLRPEWEAHPTVASNREDPWAGPRDR